VAADRFLHPDPQPPHRAPNDPGLHATEDFADIWICLRFFVVLVFCQF